MVDLGVEAIVGGIWVRVFDGPVECTVCARTRRVGVGASVDLEGEVDRGGGDFGGGYDG